MKAERRYIRTEVRAVGDGNSPKIAGHAALFNVRSQDLGGFVEIIAPGAFDACLATNPDILGLFNHDMDAIPLGRTTSGTCRVFVDSLGLAYEIDPPDTQLARDLIVSLRRKDVTGSSFGFYCLNDDWVFTPEGDLIRTVLEAEIFDVSPVTNPAYLQTDSGVRSLRGLMPQNDEALRAMAAEKRAALTAAPVAVSQDEHWRLRMMLQLAQL